MHFSAFDGKTNFTKAEMIDYARLQRYPTNEAQFERWVDYGLLGKAQKRDKGYWSWPQMRLFLNLLEQNQQPGIHPIALCAIPVWGWLILGSEADIQIDQIERVMWTWQAMQLKHPNEKHIRTFARETINQISHAKPVGQRKLQQKMIAFARTFEYPAPEEQGLDPADDFLDALSSVIDPQRRDEHQGPQGVPLSSEQLFNFFETDRKAAAVFLKRKTLPREYWRSARNMILFANAHFQQTQPQFAHETADKESAKLFEKSALDEIISHVCYSLRSAIGLILLQPALHETWDHVETTTKIVTSPLPDGSHYSYLQIEAHLQAK